jgi:hypothetical protein
MRSWLVSPSRSSPCKDAFFTTGVSVSCRKVRIRMVDYIDYRANVFRSF